MYFKRLSTIAMSAALTAAMAFPALAADADWAQPVDEGVSTLTKTLVAVAGGLIGLSIVGYGLWSALKQRLEWEKLWIFFVCGLLVTIGPMAIVWWIELLNKNS